MTYKVTIADIARELNTTPATVSRALSGHPGISEETRTSVNQVASRLNYKRNRIASSLRSGKSHVIGVIIPSAKINFFGSVVHGIECMANGKDYTVLIYQSDETREQEIKGLETFLGARVDGILVSLAKDSTDHSHFREIAQRGIPLVFFDRTSPDLAMPSVVVDDFKGAYAAVSHLIEQGYTRIAHIAGPQHLSVFSDRYKGYCAALVANGMTPHSKWICGGDISIESGKAAIDHFLSGSEPPDAVFAVEDFTALGAIRELKARGIRIPQDFGVIGFANELFGEHISPGLSTIDQQTVAMGRASCTLLLDIIAKKTLDKGAGPPPGNKVVIEPLPIFRDSSLRKTCIL